MESTQKITSPYQNLYKELNKYLHIDTNAIHALEKILKIKAVDKDEYLSKMYEHQRQIGFVLNGIVRVYHLNENGIEYNKNFFSKNDLFMTSLDTQPESSVFIQTLTPCQIILFDYADFMELSLEYPILEKVLNKILLEYMTAKQKREIELLSFDAKERYRQFVKKNPSLSVKLPQFHIASYLGITPTQLSRIKKISNNQHM